MVHPDRYNKRDVTEQTAGSNFLDTFARWRSIAVHCRSICRRPNAQNRLEMGEFKRDRPRWTPRRNKSFILRRL